MEQVRKRTFPGPDLRRDLRLVMYPERYGISFGGGMTQETAILLVRHALKCRMHQRLSVIYHIAGAVAGVIMAWNLP
jgi:hypothetical protein